MFNGITLIVANGEIFDQTWLIQQLYAAEQIVVADGGARHVFNAQIVPDIVIGDMDSTPADVQTWLNNNDVEQVKYSAEKDETDLELALRYASENFESPIHIAGAIGGRVDHMLANMLLLANTQRQGQDIRIIEPYQELFVVRDRVDLVRKIGYQLSLVPLSENVIIAETAGLKWPLKDEVLRFGGARGVSNLITSDSASIIVKQGVSACILTEKNWAR